MNWGDFAAAAPDLARLGEERIRKHGLVLVGTIRRDGTPRISPVEPFIVDGGLYLGMMWQSRKALDLLHDPRCLAHTIITDREGTDGEFKLRGRAVAVRDPEVRARYGHAVYDKTGWQPQEPYHVFALDIDEASFVQYGDERQTVKRWRSGSREESAVRAWTGSGYADA